MKIAAVCCTYNRPELLANSLWMFQQQTHKDKELVILDDAGQYDNQEGDNWRLISLKTRFKSFGEKRNVCVSLTSPDIDTIAVWDDDDLYMPWALAAHAKAIKRGVWTRPSLCWDMSTEWGGKTILAETSPNRDSYHGAWGFSKEAFQSIGGYQTNLAGDRDSRLGYLLCEGFGPSIDPLTCGFEPYYVYCYGKPVVRFNDFKDWNRKKQATPQEIARWGEPKRIGQLIPKPITDYPPKLTGPQVPWLDRHTYKKERNE